MSSYEQKARALAIAAQARLTLPDVPPCADCGGIEAHEPSCQLLKRAQSIVGPTLEEPLTLEQVKALHIARVLREKNWRKSASAKALGIDRRTLHRLIDRYGITKP